MAPRGPRSSVRSITLGSWLLRPVRRASTKIPWFTGGCNTRSRPRVPGDRWFGTPDGLGPLGRGHPWCVPAAGSAAVVVPVGGWEVVLAVDEDVVGGVGDGDGGGGLRVAGARRLHAAVGVKAEHLHDVGQQSGGGAFLCGVEVQLGDVAV